MFRSTCKPEWHNAQVQAIRTTKTWLKAIGAKVIKVEIGDKTYFRYLLQTKIGPVTFDLNPPGNAIGWYIFAMWGDRADRERPIESVIQKAKNTPYFGNTDGLNGKWVSAGDAHTPIKAFEIMQLCFRKSGVLLKDISDEQLLQLLIEQASTVKKAAKRPPPEKVDMCSVPSRLKRKKKKGLNHENQ